MSTRTATSHRRAIVIGASMAGLLAGRVLADHFDEVTLIERDTLPQQAASRKGVPQDRHTHVLLEKGRSTMESYLPGLTERLIQAGAVRVSDISQNIRWFHGGAYHQAGVSDLSGVSVPRPTLENSVREQVSAFANVTILERCSVLKLATTTDKRRVTGVHIRTEDKASSSTILNADLVLDASGRGSRTPVWLETLGYERPATEEIRIGLGYVTCHYPRTPRRFPNLNGIVILASPPSRRIAILLAQEENQWVLTVGGYLGDHAPTEYEGLLQAVRNLPTPDIYNMVSDLDPLDKPVAYGFPANLRHRYERLARFPEGFIVLGDALCSFNPIYGQGMTVAALEAAALDDCLKDGVEQLSSRFFTKASKIIDVSWNTAVGSDLAYPEVEGPRTPMVRFLNWYINKLHKAAQTDAEVSIAFLKVINMIAPPPTILHPRIVGRVIRGNLWPRRTASDTKNEGTLSHAGTAG